MKQLKKISILLIIALCITSIGFQTSAQSKISAHYFGVMRLESQASYDFFVGPDAGDFKTSIKGFGSGVLDFFGVRGSCDIIDIGTEKYYLSIGAGVAILKYRLANNLVFGQSEENGVTWMTDPDITHNYVNTFFGYGKSKIITTSLYFPVDINIALGKSAFFSIGGYFDVNLSARYKMKYLIGEDKIKEIIRSDEFRKFNPSTTKFGVNATLFIPKLGYGLSATYSLTPFFKPGMGPDIHEARISATYNLHPWNLPKKKNKDTESSN
jgi:hypothetical protein